MKNKQRTWAKLSHKLFKWFPTREQLLIDIPKIGQNRLTGKPPKSNNFKMAACAKIFQVPQIKIRDISASSVPISFMFNFLYTSGQDLQ